MRKIFSKRNIIKFIIAITDILFSLIGYKAASGLIMMLYAGTVTHNMVLLSIPVIIVSITYMAGRWLKKKGILKIREKIRNKKSTIICIFSILFFSAAFFVDYVYERPTVEKINHSIQKMRSIANESGYKYIEDLVHICGVNSLVEITNAADTIEEIVEIAQRLNQYYQNADGQNGTETTIKQYVGEKKGQMQNKMTEIDKLIMKARMRYIISLFSQIIAIILWNKRHTLTTEKGVAS